MLNALFALIFIADRDFPFVITVEGVPLVGFNNPEHAVRTLANLVEFAPVEPEDDDELTARALAAVDNEKQWSHQRSVVYSLDDRTPTA